MDVHCLTARNRCVINVPMIRIIENLIGFKCEERLSVVKLRSAFREPVDGLRRKIVVRIGAGNFTNYRSGAEEENLDASYRARTGSNFFPAQAVIVMK